MSRSDPSKHTQSTNPCKRFYSWKGSMEKGYFSHWQKDEDGGGEEIPFEGPFSFLVLDELITVTGYSERSQCGIYSNEVHNIKEDLHVCFYGAKQPFASGPWKEIKKDVSYEGGKFAFSVYGMAKIGTSWELINVKISGASLGPWIELKTTKNVFGNVAVIQRESSQEKKGKNDFLAPVFTIKTIEDKSILDYAEDLDRELQKYLDGRGVEKSTGEGADTDHYPEANSYSPPESDEDEANAELAYASEDDGDIPF